MAAFVPVVASYNIQNITGQIGQINIDRVALAQDESVGIIFRSAAVDAAVAAGYISITPTLSPTATVDNLTNYIKRLNGISPSVRAVAKGTPYP